MNILIAAHKPLDSGRPRGGEKSVSIIRDHLAERHHVRIVHRGRPMGRHINWSDLVLTWGKAAPQAAAECRKRGIPYILMVRWWRNVAPLPPGDLLERPIDESYRGRNQRLFDDAAAVITNNEYARRVIDRWYGVDALVSYVPVLGEACGRGNRDGAVTLVTDSKALGGRWLIEALSQLMPDEHFLVVNARHTYPQPNVETTGYVEDMDAVWRRTKVLLYPVYNNDVCGTSRVAAEAMRYGIPVVANDRSGICEKGIQPIRRDATPADWAEKIRAIGRRYDEYVRQSIESFEHYDTPSQLAVFDRATEQATLEVA